MRKFHIDSAKICQLIEHKLDKPTKHNIREAELLQEFYDRSLEVAIKLENSKKELIFLRAMLDDSLASEHDLGLLAEKAVIKKAYSVAKNEETKQALRDWAMAIVTPLKHIK